MAVGLAAGWLASGYSQAALAEAPATDAVSGVVTNQQTGQPLADDCDLTISVYDGSHTVAASSGACLDSTGRYTVSGLAPGRYYLGAADSSHRYAARVSGVWFTVGAGATSEFDFSLLRTGKIAGVINRLRQGVPFAKDCGLTLSLTVHRERNGAYRGRGGNFHACTDGRGRYVISGVTPGLYDVELLHQRFAAQFYRASAGWSGDSAVRVRPASTTRHVGGTLTRGGTLQVNLVHASNGRSIGTHVCNLLLTLSPARAEDPLRYVPANNGRPTPQVTLRHVLTGRYKLRVTDEPPPPGTACYADQWFNGADTFAEATPIRVRDRQRTTITVRLRSLETN